MMYRHGVAREARVLPQVAPSVDMSHPRDSSRSELARRRLVELGDALAVFDIVHIEEVTLFQSSLGDIRKQLAPPNVATAPQKGNSYEFHFRHMVAANLWIPHGTSSRNNQTYGPALRCGGAIGDIYKSDCSAQEPVPPEVLNKDFLDRYAASEALWSNIATRRDYDDRYYPNQYEIPVIRRIYIREGCVLAENDTVVLEIRVRRYIFRTNCDASGNRYIYRTFGEGALKKKRKKGGQKKSYNSQNEKAEELIERQESYVKKLAKLRRALNRYRPDRAAMLPIPRIKDVAPMGEALGSTQTGYP